MPLIQSDFSQKAEDYAAHRPPYAAAAFVVLRQIAGLTSSSVVADIGAGTGNVTRHLLGHVQRVFAIEPEAAMRRHVEDMMRPHPRSIALAGTAEATTLPDQSVDLITVGQAIHWFDRKLAPMEFDRILRPEGWLALIWNQFQDGTVPDLADLFAGDSCQRFHFPLTMRENWTQFIGGLRSSAFHPNPGDENYPRFEKEQREVFDQSAVNGLITIAFTTELAVGRLPR